MKNKLIYILAFAVLALTSCDDKIDIIPADQASFNSVFTNKATAKLSITGLYSMLQDDDVMNGTSQAVSEWMSDNVHFVGSFYTFVQLYDYTTLSNNINVRLIWRDSYYAIGATNTAIEGLTGLEEPGFEAAEKNAMLAEARFVRAAIYFNLVNLFAQPYQVNNGAEYGLPLFDFAYDGSNTEDFRIARSTVNEIHTFIESDLDFAIANLGYDASSNTIATKGAAEALKARLHLYRGEFASARDLANSVITNGGYAAAGDFAFYNTTDNEFVFVLANTGEDGQTGWQGWSGLYNPSPNAIGVTSTFTNKFPDGGSKADNSPLIRISEMLLIRAEANFREGTSVGADPFADINVIRNRAGLASIVAGDVNITLILDERRKELAFEGFRRMDLLRNSMGLRPAGDPHFSAAAFGANKTIFPIPLRETDLNTSLQQNTGY